MDELYALSKNNRKSYSHSIKDGDVATGHVDDALRLLSQYGQLPPSGKSGSADWQNKVMAKAEKAQRGFLFS